MGSISISLWRCRIGTFSVSSKSKLNISKDFRASYGIKKPKAGMILIAITAIVYVNIAQILLVTSGLETNPGPKDCSHKGESMYLYKKWIQGFLRFDIL